MSGPTHWGPARPYTLDELAKVREYIETMNSSESTSRRLLATVDELLAARDAPHA
jgi:hypothetical protein